MSKSCIFIMFRKLPPLLPQWSFYRQYSSALPTLGFIGLGNLGAVLAYKLINSGNTVVGYDQKPERVKKMVAKGLIPASSPAEVAKKAQTIFSTLPEYKEVINVYEGKKGVMSTAKKNTILVDLSTIGPVNAVHLQIVLAENHLKFISAAVCGDPEAASDLIFLVSGSKDLIYKIELYLHQMSKKGNVFYMGPEPGDSQSARICCVLLLACSLIGTAEVMNLGMRLGLDPIILVKCLNASSAQCWSCQNYNPVPQIVSNVPSNRHYAGGESVNVFMKSLQIAQDVAIKIRAPIPLGALACQIYTMAMSRGYADKDISVVYKLLQQTLLPGT